MKTRHSESPRSSDSTDESRADGGISQKSLLSLAGARTLMIAALAAVGCAENNKEITPISPKNSTPIPVAQPAEFNDAKKERVGVFAHDGNYDGAMRDPKYRDTITNMTHDPYFDINSDDVREMMQKYTIVPGPRLKALANYRSGFGHVGSISLNYVEDSKKFSEWCRDHGMMDIATEEDKIREAAHVSQQKRTEAKRVDE